MYQKTIENSPGVDFNTPALKRKRSLRFLKDNVARWAVAVGGLGVIAAITLIFFYLVYEVAPLFKGATITPQSTWTQSIDQDKPSLYMSMEEQGEIALSINRLGELNFRSTRTGDDKARFYLPLPTGTEVTTLTSDSADSTLMAAGLSDGQAIVFKYGHKISWPNDQRVITPVVEYPYGKEPLTLGNASLSDITLADNDRQLFIAAISNGKMVATAFSKEENFLTEEVTLEQQPITLPAIPGTPEQLKIEPDQRWLFVRMTGDEMAIINVARMNQLYLHSVTDLTVGDANITDIQFLLGGVSLLTGDDSGLISQWSMVRDDNNEWSLQRIRDFKLTDNPITSIKPEHRRKGFLAADTEGNVGVFYTTAGRSIIREKLSDGVINQMAISPRSNYLLVDGQNGVEFLRVKNEHPEVSFSALWQKVWYEGYEQPEYIWQSSASNNDFEPKLSLTPLSFGTLKAAFYAMLLATPLAIAGAIYTAYFMAPGMRRKVKPMIELMEALPTVILGFLAGLWLAPLIENNLPGIFALLLFVPVGILLFAFIWDALPSKIRHSVPEGWQAALLVPVVLLSGYVAFSMNTVLEVTFFNGDMRTWLTSELGIPYDQRNALVVGLAMGFAVIPTIFSIAEDAIFSVPKHLSYGSLALGATPWQTLVRVVLLTASPGIFSAVMIGMGRAVGETMIVLMATGNTPIMDVNIFEGMRTLAANIAVEMPESEVGSSHYRILFLAALVLFLFTFVVNTAAEIVRHRLRKKYSSL
ncbi:phosphate ABC transporter permease [Endozoicomonas montiporae]|uniref:Phosphate ABC transporter permease n=3 Tax=Endozoicomonas montiporae TaxID=1027273 RepID=A0A081N0N7_9GAMM|nr:ABC transporter permease subunit [Endozoicomonas montiporae]AMO54485.1 phosphate ABC transporter permease [Endozoicomonas montiporae CL-33]KEQ12010.1 phosphate ABC transporter permease [Endozoicomonas montiporae]